MDWAGTAAVAFGAALVGAVAGGVATYFAASRVQKSARLRETQVSIYIDNMLEFEREVNVIAEDVHTSGYPISPDHAQVLLRDLFRVAVVSSKEDAETVDRFVPQLEAIRVVYADCAKTTSQMSNEEKDPIYRDAATKQASLWETLALGVAAYRRSLEQSFTGGANLHSSGEDAPTWLHS